MFRLSTAARALWGGILNLIGILNYLRYLWMERNAYEVAFEQSVRSDQREDFWKR